MRGLAEGLSEEAESLLMPACYRELFGDDAARVLRECASEAGVGVVEMASAFGELAGMTREDVERLSEL